MNKAWAFRKRAALDPSQDFTQEQLFVYSSSFPSHFLFFHLLPFSGCLLHPGGGDGAKSREWGGRERGEWLLSNRPPSLSRLLWWVLYARETVTHTSEASSPGGVLGSSPACGHPGSHQAGLCLPRWPAAADLIRAPIMEAQAIKGP